MDLFHAGLLMNAKFAARLPFEVLHGIGDIDFAAIDVGLFQTFIEQSPRRTDKGSSLFVFLVSWLFADHHDGNFRLRGFGPCLQLSEDCLWGSAIEITTVTFLRGLPENS